VSLRYLLDTNTLSIPFRDPDHPIVARLSDALDESAVPAPVWHELRFGVSRLPKGKKRDALEAYVHDVVLASYPILPYDQPAADWHGIERARLERKGINVPFVDGQIASIAHVSELVLVTHNPKDFRHFADLSTQDWFEGK
jgi:tRNA(fMet)-specific endonuclease VapC